MQICGAEHPEHPDMTCDKQQHPFGSHMHWESKTTWPGLPVPPKTKSKKSRTDRVAKVAEEVRLSGRADRVGSPSDVRAEAQRTAHAAWDRDRKQWLESTKEGLRQICLENAEFTLEKLWAITLDTPERRAMAVVVQHGKRQGWMREKSAVRPSIEWHTADGQTFLLDKFVPLYESLLFSA